MPDDELLERVRELRARGRSPKEIARALKVRPATVTPLIRRLAAAEPQEEAPLIGCWVNQGWSSSVRFTGHPEWPDTAAAEAGESGLVIVVVARERGSSVRVCEFLVDTWCLGVKNAPGPKPVERRKLPSFTSASGIGFAVGFAMFGALAYLPQYMQVVRGLSATLSGLRLLRMMAGVPATGKILYRPVRLTSWPVPMEVSRTSSDTPRRLPCLRSGAPSWSGIRTATFTCRRAVTRRPVPVSRAAP